jgi:hypothetical protein
VSRPAAVLRLPMREGTRDNRHLAADGHGRCGPGAV